MREKNNNEKILSIFHFAIFTLLEYQESFMNTYLPTNETRNEIYKEITKAKIMSSMYVLWFPIPIPRTINEIWCENAESFFVSIFLLLKKNESRITRSTDFQWTISSEFFYVWDILSVDQEKTIENEFASDALFYAPKQGSF